MYLQTEISALPCKYHNMQQLELERRNDTEIRKLNFTRVIVKENLSDNANVYLNTWTSL